MERNTDAQGPTRLNADFDVAYRNCAFSGYHYAYGGVLNCNYTSDSAASTLKLTLEDCAFHGNVSKYGGAVYLAGSDNIALDAKRCVFSDGASSTGGAIRAKDAKIGLLDCDFTNNFYLPAEGASSSGGAIYLDGCGADLKSKGKTGIRLEETPDGFHTFGMEWSKNGYRFFVDGVMTWETDGPVSDREEFILVSAECKGYRADPASPDPALEDALDDAFVVDYVRVFDEMD